MALECDFVDSVSACCPRPLSLWGDRALYFARGWPNHEAIGGFELLDVCAEADRALVRYHASTVEGGGFSNVDASSSPTT